MDNENIISSKLEPENEFGNVEYKEKLLNKTQTKIEKLTSQMRYRCNEGEGEAVYILGVSDEGNPIGVSDEEFAESFNNLSIAASENNYSISMLTSKTVPLTEKKVYELLVREKNDQKYIDIKVTVAGNVDAGKSSLIGTLISGQNDDGRGSSRLLVFNFKHEINNGRTSSIAHHILGFDSNGKIMNYEETNHSNSHRIEKKSWPDIVKKSSKIISFYDLCGHEKYLKTTILGLTSSFPDLCFIVIGANMGLTRMTHEHIFLCATLKIPFVIIVTKIDYERENVLEKTTESIHKLLKLPGLRRIPYKVNNEDDVTICSKNIHSDSIVPIFYVSNVTGAGIDNLKRFLNLSTKSSYNSNIENKSVEYHIDTTFSVPGVPTITGGQLISGSIKIGDKLLLGPNNGKYDEVQVKTIHCKRVPMQSVSHGSYVCLGLKKIDRSSIRRGNVVLSLNSLQISVMEFDAIITVLKTHSSTIRKGYTPTINTFTTRQAAVLIDIKDKVNERENMISESGEKSEEILRTGDKATVTFRFKYHSEYLKVGMHLLMTEGKIKISGVVINTR